MDLIRKFSEIFKKSNIPVYLKPYEILVVSESSGFIGKAEIIHEGQNIHNKNQLKFVFLCFVIEFLPNTLSIDALKKHVTNFKNLNDFY